MQIKRPLSIMLPKIKSVTPQKFQRLNLQSECGKFIKLFFGDINCRQSISPFQSKWLTFKDFNNFIQFCRRQTNGFHFVKISQIQGFVKSFFGIIQYVHAVVFSLRNV